MFEVLRGSKMFSEEAAQQILEKFHAKGWNMYKSHRMTGLGPEENIRQSLADRLELEGTYTLLPVADDPRNPEQVFAALEAIAVKLDRQMPTIQFGFEDFPLTGFTLREYYVRVHTPEGMYVDYSRFISALDSVVQTNGSDPAPALQGGSRELRS
jgi:hypothetical protein